MSKEEINFRNHHVVLEKTPVTVQARIPGHVLERFKQNHAEGPAIMAQVHVVPDVMLNEMIAYLQTFVLAGPPETLSVRTPATWWDHLKHDVLMGEHRFLRRLVTYLEPPVYTYASKEVKRLCPHHNSHLTEDHSHFAFLFWEDVEK